MTGPGGTNTRVLVVVVTWNSAAHVGDAVRSVPRGTPVVVVDNGSKDDSAARSEEAGARVIRADRNLGFGPACNLGAKDAPPGIDVFFFLNPDAALLEGEAALKTLLDEMDGDASIGAVAPALAGDGQDAFQLRRLPTLGSIAREALLVNRISPANAGLRRERYLDRDRTKPFDADQPAAAALLVRRSLFERLGGFDPAFVPAWFEDVDLCARIRKAGFRVRFVPAARATHVGGTTMRALAWRDFRPVYVRNEIRYLARHAGPSARFAARLLLAGGALLRLAVLPFVPGDHGRADGIVAQLRVLRGLAGLGWRSSLIGEAA